MSNMDLRSNMERAFDALVADAVAAGLKAYQTRGYGDDLAVWVVGGTPVVVDSFSGEVFVPCGPPGSNDLKDSVADLRERIGLPPEGCAYKTLTAPPNPSL